MKIFRSILSFVTIGIMVLLVSCGSPRVSAPPTYTSAKLQQIQTYRIPVDQARGKLSDLGQLISKKQWVDTGSLIHGPLGFLRRDMRYLADSLLPGDKERASEIAKEIFQHLEDIDAAAKDKNYGAAINEYKEVVSDFDAFFQLLPDTQAS
jgi:photosystem II protein PsbQ